MTEDVETAPERIEPYDLGVPVEQIRAALRMLYPEEMTPTAKRMFDSICEQHAHGSAEGDG